MPNEPFEESRRLTGSNLYFDDCGVALETAVPVPLEEALLDGWRARVGRMRAALGWPDTEIIARRHASGASLAFAAPVDQLYTAALANEWAWLASLCQQRLATGPDRSHAPGCAAAWDEEIALQTLRAMATEEANPVLVALLDAARAHCVPAHPDDDMLSLGEGSGSRVWPVRALPAPGDVPWADLHGIPLAVVTGSNGKTTTVRLLAAMARAQGWNTGYSSTDGVFVGSERIDSGDYSGPVGARTVLRHPDVEAAILETARGGLLRRGIAICNARAAVLTNVSPDHFGEYGIHALDDLADVKLTIARALAPDGLLVLNADDPLLLRRAAMLDRRIGWFALDDDNLTLQSHRNTDGPTCAVRAGRLRLHANGVTHDLGAISTMPITLGGSASYNIANAAAAALAASAMGIAVERIAGVLSGFGAQAADNPGRMQRWRFGALQVFLDYAHNPDGLRGLLQVAVATRGAGRLGLVLGQAGNREDRDIRALAVAAARFGPDRVWLKDIGGEYMRGRAPGEVAGILRDELRRQGLEDSRLVECLDETRAAREAMAWARPGDVLVLPIHEPVARDAVVALLDRLQAAAWRPEDPLPDARP